MEEILKSDESCISNPKFDHIRLDFARPTAQFKISDFGFEMQDSSDFKIFPPRFIQIPTSSSPPARVQVPCRLRLATVWARPSPGASGMSETKRVHTVPPVLSL